MDPRIRRILESKTPPGLVASAIGAFCGYLGVKLALFGFPSAFLVWVPFFLLGSALDRLIVTLGVTVTDPLYDTFVNVYGDVGPWVIGAIEGYVVWRLIRMMLRRPSGRDNVNTRAPRLS